MQQTPEQLLVRVRSGDRDAYAQLYALLAGNVQGILRQRLASNPALVDEVLQETWIRVWKYARRYDPALGPALGWIASIARNEANRQLAARGSTDELDADLASSLPDLDVDELPGRLRSLPLDELDLKICYLVFYLDHTQAELAQQLDLPLGTVKGRMRRILKIVRNEYGEGQINA
jgi:RNA polymerase sigma-70 factor (ECF subfamily)